METDPEVKYPLKMRATRLPILILGLNGVPGFALFRHFNKLYGTDTAASNAQKIPGVIGIRPIKHPCVFGDNVFGINSENVVSKDARVLDGANAYDSGNFLRV